MSDPTVTYEVDGHVGLDMHMDDNGWASFHPVPVAVGGADETLDVEFFFEPISDDE